MATPKLRLSIGNRPCRVCNLSFSSDKAQCPGCGAWQATGAMQANPANDLADETVLLSDVPDTAYPRIDLGMFNKIFGGGLTRGSVNLLGGAPGAGKSTMSLQLATIIAKNESSEVLYIAAEEASVDVKARAVRIGADLPRIRVLPMGALSDLGTVFLRRSPCAVILDSLPAFVSDPEEAVTLCHILKSFAVKLDAPMLVVDHITKSDDFAGTMKLQHAVDATFTLYPADVGELRTFTTIKNRFGPANVELLLMMTPKGLREAFEEDLESAEGGEAEK